MIDFRPEHIANLIQRSPEFASIIKKRYPELVPDVVSFALNPDCSCKKKIIRFGRKKNAELNELINKWLDENQNLNINLEAIFKNQPIQENRVRKEMNLTPEQIEFLNKRKQIVEQKRKKESIEKVNTKKAVEAIKKVVIESEPKSESKKETPVVRDLAGEVIELEEPNPAAYKKMIKYIRQNNWNFKGLSVLETEKIDEKTNKVVIVWLVFFF